MTFAVKIKYIGASQVAQMVKNLPANEGDLGSIPGSGRYPEEENGNPLQFLPGKFHGQRSLVGYILHGVAKSQTQLSNFHFTFILLLSCEKHDLKIFSLKLIWKPVWRPVELRVWWSDIGLIHGFVLSRVQTWKRFDVTKILCQRLWYLPCKCAIRIQVAVFSCLVAKLYPTLCDPMDCVACQAPLSMGFPRQEYRSGLSFPSPGDLPDPENKFIWRQVLCH